MNPLVILLLVVIVVIVLFGVFTVRQQSAAIVQRFGKFHSVRQAGIQLRIPLVDQIAGRINLRIQQLDEMLRPKQKTMYLFG